MNSRDRVLTALNREQPDKVPIFELSIDNTHQSPSSVYNLICGIQSYVANRFNNTMNLKEAKEKWGDKVCICGIMDCGITLVYGPKQRIIDEVKQCIKDAAEGGGYILSSSNSIHFGVPIKNYQIMVDTGRKYGVYI